MEIFDWIARILYKYIITLTDIKEIKSMNGLISVGVQVVSVFLLTMKTVTMFNWLQDFR